MATLDATERRERIVMSIPEFCSRYGISKSFYAMRAKGLGPRELRLSERRVVILESAAREWERSREHVLTAAGDD